MIEFSKQIAEKWNISGTLAELLSNAFQKGDTPYYLAEYRPEVAVELSIAQLWEIYDFLIMMEDLSAKKKRVVTALKKAEKLTPGIEKRVGQLVSSFELDDMLLPLRPNPRSKGQLAIKKGLEPLADSILKQEEQNLSIEELAETYVGKDPSLKSAADVLQGVKDVLAERFAYDDTVRSMVREFAEDDGYFEVFPKKGLEAKFSNYLYKQIPLVELTKEEILNLLAAEDRKDIRLKLSVQLFRITELLRHHFIQNPDFSGFDLLCEVIDDAWLRLFQPIIERDVKIKLREDAEEWAIKKMVVDLEKKYTDDQKRGTILIADAGHPKSIVFIAVSGRGELLGTTSERKLPDGKVPSFDRVRQFLSRHRPDVVLVIENEGAAIVDSFITSFLQGSEQKPEIRHVAPDAGSKNPSDSEWIQKKYGILFDEGTKKLFDIALQNLQPIELLPHIGTEYYSVHPLQSVVSAEKFIRVIDRVVTNYMICKGTTLKDITETHLVKMGLADLTLLQAFKAADAKEPVLTKNDLLKLPGMTEVIFRNIAGFVVIPLADDFRDRSLVHPDHFSWIDEASEQLNVSNDTILSDVEILRSFATDDFLKKVYFDQKLIPQVKYSIRFPAQSGNKIKRKYKLTELKEGAIVSGRVTNITQFGVFININAVCDGLIHISQLADEYVESPEQVVLVHDKVDVRILKVDIKKRRISLSMKNLGKPGPRVKPSEGQLSTLADHFKNR